MIQVGEDNWQWPIKISKVIMMILVTIILGMMMTYHLETSNSSNGLDDNLAEDPIAQILFQMKDCPFLFIFGMYFFHHG